MSKRICCNSCGQPLKGADKSFTFICTCNQAKNDPPLCRQEQTLQDAFKHGAYARLRGEPREPTYDNPPHRAQWLKGWDCTDVNQTSYQSKKQAKLDRIKREGRDACRAGKVISGCPYSLNQTGEAGAWVEGFRSEARKYQRLVVDEFRTIDESMIRNMIVTSNPSGPGHDFVRDHFRGKCPVKLYIPARCPGKSQAQRYIEQINQTLNPFQPTKEQTKMNTTIAYIFASMLPEVVGVIVQFPDGGKYYTYKALKSQNIEKGQLVVVDSPFTGKTAVTVEAVTGFDDLDPGAYNGYKWIVGVVSTGDYAAVTEKEQAFQLKVAELRRKAKREKAVAALADEVGGLDALRAIMAELSGSVEAPGTIEDAAAPAPAAE